MLFDLIPYLAIFALSSLMIAVFQKECTRVRIRGISENNKIVRCTLYCIVGLIFALPIIAMYSLRYGIGTDYFNYERIYNNIHNASFHEYWLFHNSGVSSFYVEPGYYLLNKVFPDFRLLLWGIGILIFTLLLIAIKDYVNKISFSLAFFVYLSTQFIYSLNGIRFAIAVCFILLSYVLLIHDSTKSFIVMVLLATLFHQTALFCLAMLFLKQYKYKEANSVRNFSLFLLIALFPILADYLLGIASNISVFERYFTTLQYEASSEMSGSWMWVLHVIPVVFPLLIFCRKEIFRSEDTSSLFRICITEIPLRMLGLYNTWYTRLVRYAQIAQVIFIPLVLANINSKKKKVLLYIYYIAWYIFYFGYYAIVNDQGDSLPYVWIFS